MPRTFPDPSPGAGRFLHGAAWSALNAAAGALLPLGIFVIFARWLPAAEIGAVALAVAVSEIIKAFGLPGLYEALLQQREDRQRAAETALACLLLGGFGLFGLHLLLTPLLVWLVPGVEQAGLAIAVLGLRIPLDLAALQPQAILAERLSFRRLALRSILATTGAGAAGLSLLLAGHPMAGLVTYQLGLSALLLLLTAAGTGTLVWPRLHRDCLRRLRQEAAHASAVRLVAAVNNYLDQVLVAGLLGGLQLAYYNLAKRVETILITAAASFGGILFQPVFARRRPGDTAEGLRRGLMVLTASCGLATAVIMATHLRLITLVFGPAWAEAAPVAALLALGGFLRALGSAHGSLLSVSGRNRQLLRVSLCSAGSGLALVLLLAPVGLIPCALALALRSLGSTAAMAWLTRHDLPGTGRVYALEVALPFGAMLAGAWAGEALAGRVLAGAEQDLASGLLTLAAAGTAATGLMLLSFGLRLLCRRWFAMPRPAPQA
ncbi:oligosaccharide flippase family protein [Roseicella sp. DB1501]|uniref:oligosaccharide flippase family protein n=1 Tax=Roseicella sp. DB1501 TaxID=2730925 RepID=UPI001492649A|nr:oligosaccharide flippase family protein [Roseicella sp. DB1501]NOG74152.1 oligosaccharide flippase family protein [Roseicella sp. DB1501]